MFLGSTPHLEQAGVCSYSWLLLQWWPLRDLTLRKPTGQRTLHQSSQERTETYIALNLYFQGLFLLLFWRQIPLQMPICILQQGYIKTFIHTNTHAYFGILTGTNIQHWYFLYILSRIMLLNLKHSHHLPPKCRLRNGLIEARYPNTHIEA